MTKARTNYKTKIDWEPIKELYIKGKESIVHGVMVREEYTLTELADISGCNESTLREKAEKYWKKEKQLYLELQKSKYGNASDLGEYDKERVRGESEALQNISKLNKVLGKYIEDRWGEALDEERGEEIELDGLTLKELESAVSIAKEIYKVGEAISKNAPVDEIKETKRVIKTETERQQLIGRLRGALLNDDNDSPYKNVIEMRKKDGKSKVN